MSFTPALVNAEELHPRERVDGVLNQWKAFQSNMNDRGILMETTNTVDVLSNVSGGIDQKTAAVGDLDLLLTVDMKKLVPALKSGTLFVYGLGTYGDDPSKHVGDIQAVSNIAAPNTWKLFEAWYQQNLSERFSLLAGLYDVTSEFDVMMSSSELFVNSSFGTGAELAASGKNGPSTFPATSLGIRGQAIVTDSLMVRAVLTDGVPGDPDNPHGTHIQLSQDDGLFSAMEFAYYKFREGDIVAGKPRRLTFRRIGRSAPLEYEAKAAIGFWGYTTTLDHLSKVKSSGDPSKQHGTYGMYGLAEYDVYHEKGDNDQELTLFVRAGMADPKVNRFSQYYGGGLVYTGLFPGRNFDQTGMGAAAAVNGKYYKRSQRQAGQSVNNAEITVEVTHSIYVNSNLFIQPDVQYVLNPGTVPGRKNAFVLGVRLEFNFNWFNPSRVS
ncbi:MAG: carbohydrate porin [Nitrospirota bacterium]|nr:carbohydrate porin [Nitrospirota bacterium]